jgi:glycosyltransferase involved in cell wall biosynthesis
MKKVFTFSQPEDADVIFCASIVKMNEALSIKSATNKPLVVYCWDYYKWAHEGADNYNWKRYADLMKRASLVIVPSSGQKRRLKELLDLDSEVVLTGAPTYEAEATDGGFILDPVRYYPEENRNWAETAAQKLGIPIVHSEHQFTAEEFKKLVASCTFMTSCYREASTGGLTLIEGLYLGKPSLISNSPYQGANDYLGKYAYKFQYDDFDDLVRVMEKMWKERPKFDVKETRAFIETMSYDKMAQGIYHLCTQIS